MLLSELKFSEFAGMKFWHRGPTMDWKSGDMLVGNADAAGAIYLEASFYSINSAGQLANSRKSLIRHSVRISITSMPRYTLSEAS